VTGSCSLWRGGRPHPPPPHHGMLTTAGGGGGVHYCCRLRPPQPRSLVLCCPPPHLAHTGAPPALPVTSNQTAGDAVRTAPPHVRSSNTSNRQGLATYSADQLAMYSYALPNNSMFPALQLCTAQQQQVCLSAGVQKAGSQQAVHSTAAHGDEDGGNANSALRSQPGRPALRRRTPPRLRP
jgi:hypothetical protein